MHILELVIFALERDRVGAPAGLTDLDIFIRARAPVAVAYGQGGELAFQPTGAEPEDDAAAR